MSGVKAILLTFRIHKSKKKIFPFFRIVRGEFDGGFVNKYHSQAAKIKIDNKGNIIVIIKIRSIVL
jgi:hypothetical protein